MRLAIIAPPRDLGLCLMSDYHMCLARVVLQNEEYADFYRQRVLVGQFVIMDNGAAEEGTLTPRELWKAYELVRPDEVVMPDVVNNLEGSVKLIETYRDCPGLRLVVPQGLDIGQWLNCYYSIGDQCDFTTVGVSKYSPIDRPKLLREIEARHLNDHNDFHLLGVQHDPHEVQRLAKMFPWVRGIDTGAPVAWAQSGRRVDDYYQTGHLPLQWDFRPNLTQARDNIQLMKGWANGA